MRGLLLVALALAAAGCASPAVDQSGESREPHGTGSGSGVNCLGEEDARNASSQDVVGSDARCLNASGDENLR